MTPYQIIAFCDPDNPEDRPAIFDALEELGWRFPPRYLRCPTRGRVLSVTAREAYVLLEAGHLTVFDLSTEINDMPGGWFARIYYATQLLRGVTFGPRVDS